MEKPINIPEVEKKYKDEWLLFEVLERDELRHPIKGRLLAHSPDRDAVYDYLKEIKVNYFYLAYTGESPKKGYMAAL